MSMKIILILAAVALISVNASPAYVINARLAETTDAASTEKPGPTTSEAATTEKEPTEKPDPTTSEAATTEKEPTEKPDPTTSANPDPTTSGNKDTTSDNSNDSTTENPDPTTPSGAMRLMSFNLVHMLPIIAYFLSKLF